MVGGLKWRPPFAKALFRFADGLLDYDPALLRSSARCLSQASPIRFVSLGFENDEARNGYQVDQAPLATISRRGSISTFWPRRI